MVEMKKKKRSHQGKKNSRQELALRGNKRQREDATVGVDGG